MEDQAKEIKQAKDGFNEKLILALAPAIGYYFVFRYEVGYCATFSIPSYLIRPDLTTVLVFASAVLVWSTLLFTGMDSWLDIVPQGDVAQLRPWQRLLGRYFPFLLIVVFLAAIYGRHWHRWWWVPLFVFSYFVGELTWAKFRGAKDKSLIEQIATGPSPMFHHGSVFHFVRSRFGLSALILLIAFVFGSLIAFSIGNAEALQQSKFLVPLSQTNSVLIRAYGDRFICVELDPESKKPKKNFIILYPDREKNIRFELKTLGPLNFN